MFIIQKSIKTELQGCIIFEIISESNCNKKDTLPTLKAGDKKLLGIIGSVRDMFKNLKNLTKSCNLPENDAIWPPKREEESLTRSLECR